MAPHRFRANADWGNKETLKRFIGRARLRATLLRLAPWSRTSAFRGRTPVRKSLSPLQVAIDDLLLGRRKGPHRGMTTDELERHAWCARKNDRVPGQDCARCSLDKDDPVAPFDGELIFGRDIDSHNVNAHKRERFRAGTASWQGQFWGLSRDHKKQWAHRQSAE